MMPQKRNPDAAELVRAKAGRILGALNGLLVVLKGLPMTYSKDLQEDKEPVFDACDTLELMLAAMTGMLGDLHVEKDAMRIAAEAGYSTATDLADWLVRELGLPFREAHQTTGQIVKLAERQGCRRDELGLEAMREVEERINSGVFDVLSAENSLASRTSFGGAAPNNVRRAIIAAKEKYL